MLPIVLGVAKNFSRTSCFRLLFSRAGVSFGPRGYIKHSLMSNGQGWVTDSEVLWVGNKEFKIYTKHRLLSFWHARISYKTDGNKYLSVSYYRQRNIAALCA